MENRKAIPDGYMTVGELAGKMGTTVRTLQYYDRVGLLKPAAASEGGRRLYTHKDMIRLHQIQSLKSLGFSLDDIKNRLIPLDTPEEVAEMLAGQEQAIRQQIRRLEEVAAETKALREEVLKIKEVDFKKYADIIVNLQMNNEFYWLIKHFDERTLDHIRNRFDWESGMAFIDRFNKLDDRVLAVKESGVPPEDDRAMELAVEFWDMVVEFTGGDMSMLPELMEFGNMMDEDHAWARKQAEVNQYLQPGLERYFRETGMDPFGKEGE
ncbi:MULTISPECIES: MerR family transcriptional regulator [Eubacteriales]|uniref:MerR family transcriptional regulator n=1 Tax=Eubacteriales TaxID=186802 RepID=UPI001105F26B|nr:MULTISPECIES: MerR family transcriptional regulator [Eubacteriales]